MRPPKDDLPAPPELPSFRIEEESADVASEEERHAGTGLVRHKVRLPPSRIDADAMRVVHRLERAGYQAYLVGGCVRDLLLGGTPKDFDVATSARPEDVRRLFRNCRVIGRRFRLAHVLFGGGKVIEVATFRRNPSNNDAPPDSQNGFDDDDLLIRDDNSFGDAHEDALRRDFTINALFYDVDRRQVLDWCGGMDDIRRRTIHTIGEASVRFREDPVRLLRAIKFAGRLDLAIAPDVYDAMVAHTADLELAARPRLFEEVLRLLRGGASHRSMYLLWEIGAMQLMLPDLAAFLDDDGGDGHGAERFFRRLDALDHATKERGAPLDDAVLVAALLQEPLEEAVVSARDRLGAMNDVLESLSLRIAIPRRIVDAVRRIVAVIPRLRQGKLGRFARSELVGLALELLEMDEHARREERSMAAELRKNLGLPEASRSNGGAKAPRAPRRRRGRR